MKKIILLILISMMLIPSIIHAETEVDPTKKVYDYADLLTEEEEHSLYSKITSAIEKTNLDIVFVTINENDKASAQDYADDFFDYNGFGINSSRDGILFLIDMDTRNVTLSTTGSAIVLFDDARIELMLDHAYNYASGERYNDAANQFVKDVENYFDAGKPESNKHYNVDKNGNVIREKSINWGITIIGSIIVASIIIFVLISKHKMIIAAKYAHEYIDQSNIRVYTPIDTFLTTYTSKTRINDDSSSGSGSFGGSSTHTSSSGSSHGGGSRGF